MKKHSCGGQPEIRDCGSKHFGCSMNSLELTSTVTALANALATSLTLDQITLLASILVQLSDTLNTIVARENLCTDAKAELF